MSVEKYRARSRERRKASYEERKAKAMSGRKVLYLTCPLCGLNRPLESYKGRAAFEVKPDYAIIQVRYGGGRGIGFFLSQGESIKLEELKEQYPEVLRNLKAQAEELNTILRIL